LVNNNDILHARERIILNAIGELADQVNVPTYVVGGYVRDLLLRRESKDVDLVITKGDVFEFTEKLVGYIREKLGYSISKISRFPRYGTVQFKVLDVDVELVRSRKESYDPESFKPNVTRGTLEDDLLRRDFTINTLAVCVNTSSSKRIIDITGNGVSDLKAGLIRTPLEPLVTFYDDPTRIFRAVRFASKYEFGIEPETRTAMMQYFNDAEITFPRLEARLKKFRLIPVERIRDELNKILLQDNPDKYFKLMKELNILQFVLPTLDALFKVRQNQKYHDDTVGWHSIAVLSRIKSKDLITRLAALLHDYGKLDHTIIDENGEIRSPKHEESELPIAEMLRLKYSNNVIKRVSLLIKMHMRISVNIGQKGIRRLIRDAGSELDRLLELTVADRECHVLGKTRLFDKVINEIKNFDESERKQLEKLKLVITGNELVEYLGFPPPNVTKAWNSKYGRVIGKAKKMLEDAVIAGEIKNTKKDLLKYLERIQHVLV